METNNTLAKFVIGQTYSMRSPCDHNCIWSYVVTARTDKRVTLTGDFQTSDKTKVFGVKVWNNVETCLPLGRYSMSPILRAA